jgi:hypothetical protein
MTSHTLTLLLAETAQGDTVDGCRAGLPELPNAVELAIAANHNLSLNFPIPVQRSVLVSLARGRMRHALEYRF